MPCTLLGWKPVRKNSLLGFAEVRLGGLIIQDVPVNTINGRMWAALPSKPMIDREGTVMRDDAGKIRYVALLRWANRETGDRFSEAVIAAIQREHPDALTA